MGNAAIARGAIAAGLNLVCGYPGTPSTEVLETAAKTNDEYAAIWKKYKETIPSLCVKGTEFYNACIKKANELHS